jgi:hypothetical protein
MIIDTHEVMAALCLYKDLGDLQQVILNKDGSMTVVYQFGLLQFTPEGKFKTKTKNTHS